MKKLLLALGIIVNVELAYANLLDEFDNSTIGDPSGIIYTDTPNGGRGIIFSREQESRVQYEFHNVIPTDGTLEFRIKVDTGYNYSNYDLHENNDRALIFTTDIQGGDVTYPGSTWLYVYKNGTIRLHIAGEKYESGWASQYILDAKETSFRFGKWHSIGISFGSEGRYIRLDGKMVASNIEQTQKIGRGGDQSGPIDIPTIGESVSGIWSSNQHEGGFEGVLDTFRISESQKDWVLSSEGSTPTEDGFSIISIIPKIAIIGKPTIFTIQGENLVDGMDFSITNCNGSSIEIGSGTSTERHFLCTPLKRGEGSPNQVEIEAKKEGTDVTQISNNFTIEYRDTLLRSCEATLSVDTFVLNIPYILFDSGQDRLSFSARFSHIGNENFELETYASEVVDPLDFIGCEPAIMNKSYHISIPKMKFGENSLFGRLKFIGKSNDGKLIFNGSGEFSYE